METFTPWSDAYRQYEKEQKQTAAERFQMMFPQPIVRAGLNGPFWAGLKGPKISRIKKANAPKSF